MNTIGLYSVFRKEIRRFMEVWLQTLAAPVVSNLLFLVVFGVALADRTPAVAGYDYLQILIPGLAAMGLMMNAFGNPLGSIMIAKYTNVITELLTIPLRGFEIAIAYIAAGTVRGILVGIVTVVVGLFFAPVPFANVPLILLFALLLGGIFTSLGAIVAIISKDFDQASVFQNFLLTPLIYLGGVFFSVRALPGVMQTLSRFNPLFYMIDGFRYGFLGTGDAPLWLSLLVTVGTFVLTFGVTSWMFHTGYRLKT